MQQQLLFTVYNNIFRLKQIEIEFYEPMKSRLTSQTNLIG